MGTIGAAIAMGRRNMRFAGTVILLVALVSHSPDVRAQHAYGTPEYNQHIRSATKDLQEFQFDHPDLVMIYNPAKFLIYRDSYLEAYPTEYKLGLIVDPCQGHSFDCCKETYGTPEYLQENVEAGTDLFGQLSVLTADNVAVVPESSRLPDDEVLFDETCDDLAVPEFRCLGLRAARQRFSLFPVCWDYNTSVDARSDCRAPLDGRVLPHCVAVGYSSTSYVGECNNQFADDPHCGTYLEIHKPDDERVLSATKLRGQLFSGYRMTALSMMAGGRLDRTLCRGEHEIWWVVRTRYNFIVEMKKKFYITEPECDWDFINQETAIFRTIHSVDWAAYGETPPTDDDLSGL